MKPTSVLGRPVELLQIGPNGWTEQIEADPRDRAEIARTYGLSEVRSLTAEVTIARVAGGAFAVDGRVAATIVQPCVVTLEPVEQSFVGADRAPVGRRGIAACPAAAEAGQRDARRCRRRSGRHLGFGRRSRGDRARAFRARHRSVPARARRGVASRGERRGRFGGFAFCRPRQAFQAARPEAPRRRPQEPERVCLNRRNGYGRRLAARPGARGGRRVFSCISA